MRYGNQKKRKGTKGGVTVDFNHNPTDTTSSFVNTLSSTEQQRIVATTEPLGSTSPKSTTEFNTSIQSHNSHSPLNNHGHNHHNHHSMNHSQQLQLSQFHQNLPKQPQPRMNNHFGNIDSLSFNSMDTDIKHIAALQDRVNNNNKGHRKQPSNAVVNVIVANDDAHDGDDNSSSDDGEQSSSSSFTVDDNGDNPLDQLAHGHPLDDVNNTHGNGNGRGPTTPSTPITPLTPYQINAGASNTTQTSAQLRTPQMTPIMGAISGIAGGSGSNFSTPKISGMSGSTPTQGSSTTQGTDIGYGAAAGGGIQLPKPKTKGQWM